MSTANFIVDMQVYDDSSSTNDPQLRFFDYKKVLSQLTITKPSTTKVALTASATTNIPVVSGVTWLYIETDQNINVRFDSSTDDVVVAPSAAGTSDGVLFKRGTITQLDINVPGATNANVLIFMGI